MKQAILITAYKDLPHLKQIINFFDHHFSIYIHIDRKSSLSTRDIEELQREANVRFAAKRYKVNWGGFNHLQAILLLAKIALEDKKNYYFHLISGNDFPIKNPAQFKEFFERNRNKEFLNSFEVPFSGWANNGGMDRIEYFNPFDLLDFKQSAHRRWINKLIAVQKNVGLKRKILREMPKLYGGSTWWSLSRDCLEYVAHYTRSHKNILYRFKYTFCSEEFYFQTVVMNSHFKSKVENNSLRYIDWTARNGNNPAILDESDYDKITGSDAFFARKFEYPHSEDLLNKIKTRLHA